MIKISFFSLFCFASLLTTTATAQEGNDNNNKELQRQQYQHQQRSHLMTSYQEKASHHYCWKQAVSNLQQNCKSVSVSKNKRTQLAFEFFRCQLEFDGRNDLVGILNFNCGGDYYQNNDLRDDENNNNAKNWERCSGNSQEKEEGRNDLYGTKKKLPDSLYSTWVLFITHTETLCFHVQEELLHEKTNQIVSDLRLNSHTAAKNLAQLSIKSAEIDNSLTTIQTSQKQATASAETLALALREVHNLGIDVKQALDQDKEKIQAITSYVQALLAQHKNLTESNDKINEQLNAQASVVRDLGNEVDNTREKLLGGISGLEALASKTSRFIFSLDALVHYCVFALALWFITTPERTHGARFYSFLVLLFSVFVEKYCLRGMLRFLNFFTFGQSQNHHQNPQQYQHEEEYSSSDFLRTAPLLLLDASPIRTFFLFVDAMFLLYFAFFCYISPEEKQRIMLQTELDAALNRALVAASGDGASSPFFSSPSSSSSSSSPNRLLATASPSPGSSASSPRSRSSRARKNVQKQQEQQEEEEEEEENNDNSKGKKKATSSSSSKVAASPKKPRAKSSKKF